MMILVKQKEKLMGIVSPANQTKCSILIKRTGAKIAYIHDQRNILKDRHKVPHEKAPNKDGTL